MDKVFLARIGEHDYYLAIPLTPQNGSFWIDRYHKEAIAGYRNEAGYVPIIGYLNGYHDRAEYQEHKVEYDQAIELAQKYLLLV